jgi:four helix bundle protein
MARIDRFEDIAAWQEARELTKLIYNCSKVGAFSRDYDLRSQIRRASTSVMSNIAEGFERDGDKEFHQYLSDAKGSCGEVRSQLYIALDQEYIKQAQFEDLYQRTVKIGRMLSGLMSYLRRSELRGRKFSEPATISRATTRNGQKK